MGILDVCDDAQRQIFSLIHEHDAVALALTGRNMFDIFLRCYKEFRIYNVNIEEENLLTIPRCGEPTCRYILRKKNQWAPIEEALANMSNKQIDILTLKKTRLTMEYLERLTDLINKFHLKVNEFRIISCTLLRKCLYPIRGLLNAIKAKAVEINRTPRIGVMMPKLIDLGVHKRTESIMFHFHGLILLTKQQLFMFDLNDHEYGRAIWYNPEVEPIPSDEVIDEIWSQQQSWPIPPLGLIRATKRPRRLRRRAKKGLVDIDGYFDIEYDNQEEEE